MHDYVRSLSEALQVINTDIETRIIVPNNFFETTLVEKIYTCQSQLSKHVTFILTGNTSKLDILFWLAVKLSALCCVRCVNSSSI